MTVSFPLRESPEVAGELRQIFAELAVELPADKRVQSGDCSPALDVLETSSTVEIIVDLAGVPVEAIRVVFRDNVVIVAGEKAPASTSHAASYHFVECDFGRFARAVRLTGAFDVPRAESWVAAGELHIVLPKRSDRRSRSHRIPVTIHRQPPP